MSRMSRWLGFALTTALVSVPASREVGAQIIDTRTGEVAGAVTTPAFGQTFTAPAGAAVLQQFSFWVATNGSQAPEPSTFEAFLMRWNGTGPTGDVLYRSGVQEAADCCVLPRATFVTGDVPVVAGESYVAFLVSESGTLVHLVPRLDGKAIDSYSGGAGVFAFNEPCDPVTECDWSAFPFDGRDREFVATFAPARTVPEPGAAVLLAAGVVGLLVRRRRPARRPARGRSP